MESELWAATLAGTVVTIIRQAKRRAMVLFMELKIFQ